MSEAMIQADGLVKIYKSKQTEVLALQGLDLQVEEGEMLAIIGNSGSGKSTLIHTILGVFQPDDGEILVDGHNRKTDAFEAKQEIAFVTDDMIFPVGMTAVDIGKCFGPCYRAFDYKKYITLCEKFQIPLKKIMKKLKDFLLELVFKIINRLYHGDICYVGGTQNLPAPLTKEEEEEILSEIEEENINEFFSKRG